MWNMVTISCNQVARGTALTVLLLVTAALELAGAVQPEPDCDVLAGEFISGVAGPGASVHELTSAALRLADPKGCDRPGAVAQARQTLEALVRRGNELSGFRLLWLFEKGVFAVPGDTGGVDYWRSLVGEEDGIPTRVGSEMLGEAAKAGDVEAVRELAAREAIYTSGAHEVLREVRQHLRGLTDELAEPFLEACGLPCMTDRMERFASRVEAGVTVAGDVETAAAWMAGPGVTSASVRVGAALAAALERGARYQPLRAGLVDSFYAAASTEDPWAEGAEWIALAHALDRSSSRDLRAGDALAQLADRQLTQDNPDSPTVAHVLQEAAQRYVDARNALGVTQRAHLAMLLLAGFGPAADVGEVAALLDGVEDPGLRRTADVLDALSPDTPVSALVDKLQVEALLGKLRPSRHNVYMVQGLWPDADWVELDNDAAAPVDSQGVPRIAASCDRDPRALSVALARHMADQDELLSTRGGGSMVTRDFAVQGATRELSEWIEQQPLRTAVVIFAREWDRHCVWVVDGHGVVTQESMRLPAGAVDALHLAWRRSLGVDAARQQRSPRSRGVMPAEDTGSTGTQVTLAPKAAIDEIFAGVILPGEARTSLISYEHVIVIPYGALGTVPFAALPAGPDAGALIDHVALSVAPSADVFFHSVKPFAQRRHDRGCPAVRTRARPAVVVGDPDATEDPDWILPRLPGARAEARAVAARLGTEPLIGPAATVQAVAAAAADADVIYVAAHGLADPTDPLAGFLALSGGRWTAQTIQASCLDGASLAVLSACQTGLGLAHDGGVIGVARAFHLAGVQQVVMSLWSVDDAATQALMTEFATRLGGSTPPHLALREAMLVQRQRSKHASVWAAFTVFGVGNPVE